MNESTSGESFSKLGKGIGTIGALIGVIMLFVSIGNQEPSSLIWGTVIAASSIIIGFLIHGLGLLIMNSELTRQYLYAIRKKLNDNEETETKN